MERVFMLESGDGFFFFGVSGRSVLFFVCGRSSCCFCVLVRISCFIRFGISRIFARIFRVSDLGFG